ncbi:MAG: hypothetical protein GXY82_04585 [Methanospirillum sp.]|nr:hypothetical protein [Methanospirillum sp.]
MPRFDRGCTSGCGAGGAHTSLRGPGNLLSSRRLRSSKGRVLIPAVLVAAMLVAG